jgi:hypothetical protein
VPILSVPSGATAPPVVNAFPGLSDITWTGYDGSIWDLTDYGNSGVLLGQGVRGLAMPPVNRYATQSPALPGSLWRGFRTLERDVFWPLTVFSDVSSQAWLDYDRAFWATMRPDQIGTWTVTQPSGQSRSLLLRYSDDGKHVFDVDPALLGWTAYGVTLIAEQPYWMGAPITRTWMNDTPTPFFGPTGVAPSFYISSSSVISSATMPNPGDVDAYPVWTITGPSTYVKVGVGTKVIEYTATIPAGQTITIDTRPDQLSITDQAGGNQVAGLGSVQFASIPTGTSVTLSLQLTGAGSVSASLTPLYHRAW